MYADEGGHIKVARVKHVVHTFRHVMEFACTKHPEGSHKEAYYALHHMRAYVWDH
jgi:hypothetical protein